MSMDRDKILAKIRKCLALAASANPNEAATALRQAQTMMREHGLTDVDVTLAEVTEKAVDCRLQSLTTWEARLADVVAVAFGCIFHRGARLVHQPGRFSTQRRTFVFVGTGAAPEVAGYTFDVLARQCAKGRLEHIRAQPKNCKPMTKTARGDEWAYGWMCGVRDKVLSFARLERNEALLQAYVDKHYPEMGTAQAVNRAIGRNVSFQNSFGGGLEASKAVRLEHGLNNFPKKELLA